MLFFVYVWYIHVCANVLAPVCTCGSQAPITGIILSPPQEGLLSIVFTSTAYKVSLPVVEVAANDMNVLQH